MKIGERNGEGMLQQTRYELELAHAHPILTAIRVIAEYRFPSYFRFGYAHIGNR